MIPLHILTTQNMEFSYTDFGNNLKNISGTEYKTIFKRLILPRPTKTLLVLGRCSCTQALYSYYEPVALANILQ